MSDIETFSRRMQDAVNSEAVRCGVGVESFSVIPYPHSVRSKLIVNGNESEFSTALFDLPKLGIEQCRVLARVMVRNVT